MADKTARYGWTPDLPDQRDLLYAAPRGLLPLPTKVDLRLRCPPVFDQGELGSCTANAIGAAFKYELMKLKRGEDFLPSRLFIYYIERAIEQTINSDSGAQIRDGMKCVNKQGVCPESMWPYDTSKFAIKPTDPCFTNAKEHQVLSYHRVARALNQMRGCLADGYPFVFGFAVYESFESSEVAQSGKLNMPKKNEQRVGGHAVLAVGYEDEAKRFIVRNSWGAAWGKKGYFTIPYDYLMEEQLSDDFWTIRMVEV